MDHRTHPHPSPAAGASPAVLVVGGGHAGVEAALAAARMGARVRLLSLSLAKLGEMSCNPAIGGLGKGQIVREVDALGGAMGLVADATGIQFRMLNTSKGAAVRAGRCQSDRHRYREAIGALVRGTAEIELVEGAAEELVVLEREGRLRALGVLLADGRELRADAVVITTGTFLRAVMHTGESQAPGGRAGEGTSSGLSATLRRLGLRLGRLKTGTPPRLAADSIRWEALEEQHGDARPVPFSARTERARFPALEQRPCHLTWTNERTHALIRANVHRAPMYAGRIQGVGPRYCPSVEDKVMRFAERERHQVFLEPEGLDTDVIYVNGVSTSLPAEVQEDFVRTIEGLERARFLRHGYAVEYDFVEPSELDPTLATRKLAGLWLAGQINGTSGYEEAAGQGLVAGANAASWVGGRAPFVLGREEAYVGVMVDDLVVSSPREPYRMFTSRAEHRLTLRQDTAEERLLRKAHAAGLVDDAALARHAERERARAAAHLVLASVRSKEEGGRTLAEVLRRPGVSFRELEERHPELRALGLDPELADSVATDVKYAGYLEREREAVARMRRQEALEIPSELELGALEGLASEARQVLARARPRTLGQAARLAGVRPPDVALLAIHVERHRRRRATEERGLATGTT